MRRLSESALIEAGFLRWRCSEPIECYCPEDGTPLPDSDASELSSLVDLNSATLGELDRLPRVGDMLAVRITENRPYHSVEDLRNIKGITDSVFKQLQPLVTVRRECGVLAAKVCPACMKPVGSPLLRCRRCGEPLPI